MRRRHTKVKMRVHFFVHMKDANISHRGKTKLNLTSKINMKVVVMIYSLVPGKVAIILLQEKID